MAQPAPVAKYRKDYKQPDFWIDTIDLDFHLDDPTCLVTATSQIRRNTEHNRPLVLDGEGLSLQSVAINGTTLPTDNYRLVSGGLEIQTEHDNFELQIVTEVDAANNTLLEGLYKSGGAFCTQCEAEGFRRITYFLDRPDIMAVYTTTLSAEQDQYPNLLANGNKIAEGSSSDGRHWAKWHDPFPKPSYLFALVAGDFDCLSDKYITQSGREVALELYVDKGKLDRADHAMESLKKSMAWDEQRFNLEYDLDIYMIVAVDFFNMGAMENKGLNIFNSKYVLADSQTATDDDFDRIEAIIGHEYFHNWTGNRITCRDWFQLSLKEGLTVFRDQLFSADMGSEVVNRINQVRVMRKQQFAEDASPMAHPIRPEKVIEMNNFYTVTVYEKGSEVIRMMHTLLGEQGFAAGLACYFEKHDGQAVTCEDFVKCMEQGSGQDLSQFRLWYSQSGTPQLTVRDEYNAQTQQYTLHVKQHTPPTADQAEKQPLLIPLSVALYNADGSEIKLPEPVLRVTEAEQSFSFENVREQPVPALLQNFSAPVRLDYPYTEQQLCHLLAHADNDFTRWDASQALFNQFVTRFVETAGQTELSPAVTDALLTTLADNSLDPALVAEILALPSETAFAELFQQVDVDAIAKARKQLKRQVFAALQTQLWQVVAKINQSQDLTASMRRLRNLCLSLLAVERTEKINHSLAEQYDQAANMTESLGALAAASSGDLPVAESLLAKFESRWSDDVLVMDKWFALQAMRTDSQAFERIKSLTEHPAFDWENPNRVRALVGQFAAENPGLLHDLSGEGYKFVADSVIRLNSINPQVAARLVTTLSRFKRFDTTRQQLMQAELERVLQTPQLAKDVFEIANRAMTA